MGLLVMSTAAWTIPRNGRSSLPKRSKSDRMPAFIGHVALRYRDPRSELFCAKNAPNSFVICIFDSQLFPKGTFRKIAPRKQHDVTRSACSHPICDLQTEPAQTAGDQVRPIRAQNQWV